MSRGGFKITKNSFDFARSERVSWLDEFADKINNASKTAVDVARYRNELSIHDQINSIVSRQPVSTVEDLVKEYRERTGLAEYLKAQDQGAADKTASSNSEVFSDYPELRDQIINFAKNKIETSHGQTSVPHIQSEIMAQFSGNGLLAQDVEGEEVIKLISDLISEVQKQTPTTDISSVDVGAGVGLDLDDNDEENTDFYHSLMPCTD